MSKLLVLVTMVLLLPLPWLKVSASQPAGDAWRLDGRLVVEGRVIDPPGKWSWLTVGRPPLVAEVIADRLVSGAAETQDLRRGPRSAQPSLNEPAAATVGLAHAGYDLELRLVVEAIGPLIADQPYRAELLELNGIPLTDHSSISRALGLRPDVVRYTTADGREHSVPGPTLPYHRVHVLELAPAGVDASIGGQLLQRLNLDVLRELNLGRSHGLMVALVTYSDATGTDLARGRHIAGTGGVRGDGVITPIGGLEAKAVAAKRANADVLLFPASQEEELAHFVSGRMRLVPVATLREAIDALAPAS